MFLVENMAALEKAMADSRTSSKGDHKVRIPAPNSLKAVGFKSVNTVKRIIHTYVQSAVSLQD